MKGWKPANPQQTMSFACKMNGVASECSNLNQFAHGLYHSVKNTYHTTTRTRKLDSQPDLPESLKEAHATLRSAVQLDSAEIQRDAARAVTRESRKWHDSLDRARRDREALRGDRSGGKRQRHNFKHKNMTYISAGQSAECLNEYFEKAYNPTGCSAEQYTAWKQEVFTALAHASSNTPRLHLPLNYLLDCIGRICSGKATGLDQIPAESFKYLKWSAVLVLRDLFEQRLNGEVVDESSVHEAWHTVMVWCIPKTQDPKSLSEWRPVSLISNLQKLYGSCTAMLLEEECPIPREYNYGFMQSCQTMDVTFAMRLAVEKSNLWGIPLYMLRFDIRKAFDNICHKQLHAVFTRLGISPRLVAAILRELVECEMHVQVGRHRTSRPIPLRHGSKQGGRDTPTIWKTFLWGILRDLVSSWQDRGLVFQAGGACLNLLLWADDGVMFASSREDLQTKFEELVSTLESAFLGLKPNDPGKRDNLAWMTSNASFSPDVPIVSSNGVYSAPKTDHFVHLGSYIDSMNDVKASVSHRIREAWKHWHSRKEQLCRRRVPLRSRIQRWYQTIGKTLCYGMGELNLLVEDVHRLNAFSLSCFRSMLARNRRAEETPWSFRSRLNLQIKRILAEMGQPLVGSIALALHHMWAGHVVRSGEQHLARSLLMFRDCEWELQQSQLPSSQRIRRDLSGRPVTWEWRLSRCHGHMWKQHCGDRLGWKHLRKGFLAERHWEGDLPCTHSVHTEVGGNMYIANFFRSVLPQHVSEVVGNSAHGLSYLIVGDSSFTLDSAIGESRAQSPHIKQLHDKITKLLFFMGHHLKLTPANERGGTMWVPRAENSRADSLATMAITLRSTWEEFHFCSGLSPGDQIIAYFDGGSRAGDDGSVHAGCGVVLVIFRKSCAVPTIIYQGVFYLGAATNNEAESTGMWLAAKAVVAFVAWLHGSDVQSIVDANV